MSMSNYAENAVLDEIFQSGLLGAALYIALSTADPGEDCLTLAEPDTDDDYARVQKDPGSTHWNDAAAGLVDNKTDIEFAQAAGAWGTITHVALFDADIDDKGAIGVANDAGAGSGSFEVTGDVTADLVVGAKLRVKGSTANDGVYTIRSGSAYSGGTTRTTINVAEAVADDTADGTLELLGNLLYSGALTTPKAVTTGDTFLFQAGDLDITQS